MREFSAISTLNASAFASGSARSGASNVEFPLPGLERWPRHSLEAPRTREAALGSRHRLGECSAHFPDLKGASIVSVSDEAKR